MKRFIFLAPLVLAACVEHGQNIVLYNADGEVAHEVRYDSEGQSCRKSLIGAGNPPSIGGGSAKLTIGVGAQSPYIYYGDGCAELGQY